MKADTERYAAFISYSHTDARVARWLHGWLESYWIPKAFRGQQGPSGLIMSRIGKVFRDREDFAAGGELKAETEAALDRSDALIVLCSPAAAASRHVNDEVEYFKARKSWRIIPVILSGEYPSCKPPALRDVADKLSADFRARQDGRDVGALKVVAGLLGIKLDDLIRREAVARRWRMYAKIGVISLVAVLGTIASGFGVLAYRNVVHAREIHASRLTEETDFLVDQALATQDPTVAIERALQALPVDFANPERPYSPRARAALQGAVFYSTMVARAPDTGGDLVDIVLVDAEHMALAVTADGQLLQFDTNNFGTSRPAGRCAGKPERIQILDAARVVTLKTDSAVCSWTYADSTLTALPVLDRSGDVVLQADRILVTGTPLSALYYAERKWRTASPPSTPLPARNLGGGMVAFDHGNHFHLIDAFKRENLFIGCLKAKDCASSVDDFQAAEASHDRTHFVLYGQGMPFLDFAKSTNCTTEGDAYHGDCDSRHGRVPIDGENTVGVTFTPSTYVRDEFAGGYEVGNAESGSMIYRVNGRALTERSISRNGRLLAVYEPSLPARSGGELVIVHDLLSPEEFTKITADGSVKRVDLGETGRLALILQNNGKLTLHNTLGHGFAQERRWPMQNEKQAPYTFFVGDEVVGVVSAGGARLIDVDDLDQERLIALNGSQFKSARFRNREAGCLATVDEIICVTGERENRLAINGEENRLVALSADGKNVVTLGQNRLDLYATGTLERLWSSSAESVDYCCVRFSASGKTLLVSYQNGIWVGFDTTNGSRRYTLGAIDGPYGPEAVHRAQTQFLARIEGQNYGIFDIDSGKPVQEFSIPAMASINDSGRGRPEIAIDRDFSRIWYVSEHGEGVIRSLLDGHDTTVDIDAAPLGEALFAPSGRYVVRKPRTSYGSGPMVLPESMQIVDLERGRAHSRMVGGWSPAVENGILESDVLIARSYSLGLETLSVPPMHGSKAASMQVKIENSRQHARFAFIGLQDGAPYGVQSVEFSLELHALEVITSPARLLMIAVDRASNEFAVRTYSVPKPCGALKAEAEVLLGRRTSPPSADNDAHARLSWLEQTFSALLGPQRFEPVACEAGDQPR